MLRPLFPLALSFMLLLTASAQDGTSRQWTSAAGTVIEGKRIAHTDETVTIQRDDNGQKLTVKLSQLSKEDRAFIANIPEPEIKKGATTVEGISVTPGKASLVKTEDGQWGYQLYLPKAFHTGRKWPVIFVMSSGGGKKSKTMERYFTVADRLGLVVALSVESKNSFADSDIAMESMVDDAYSRLPLIEDLAFSTGMSGGSRMAYMLAERDKRIAGVLACGSGKGIYIKEKEFRPAKLRKDTYIYSLMGTTCFNRDSASRDHEGFPDDYRLQFFPGGHAWAQEPFISPAMARVYGEGLLHSEYDEIDSLKSTYLKEMVKWVDEMKADKPWEAAFWIEFLPKFNPPGAIASQLSAISKEIDQDPRTAIGIEAEEDIRKFARKNLAEKAGKDEVRENAETLARKYAGHPQAEIFELLGKPESKPKG